MRGRCGGGDARCGSRGSPAPGAGPSRRAERGGAGIYVHVAGAVRRPGLLRLPEGARVATAVERAGGPLRQADLARREPGGEAGGRPAGDRAAARGDAAARPGRRPRRRGAAPPGTAGVPKLSLGAVTVEQLDELDGIGPTLAQRIVEYRTEHGGFRSLGELRDVEGIGEKRFASLREALQP